MDFNFTEEQLSFRDEIVKFAQKELNNCLIERDKEALFSHEGWKKCAEFGIQGLPFPNQYGGSNADVITTMLAMEALGYGCKDSGLIFAVNAQMLSVQMPIWEFGTEIQKQKYLTKMCTGEFIGAHGMSEPNSGSDAFSLQTTAVKKDGKYILNGTKTFVSNAPMADLFLVFATTNKEFGFMGVTTFIIEKDFPGLSVGKVISKMGLRTSPMSEVILENCEVPVDNLLGKEGMGPRIFNSSMAWERSTILACYLGAMQRQIETCVRYTKERKQFNTPIGKFQSVANKIVDMKIRLETAKLMLYKVAWLKQQNKPAEMEAAIAKLYLSEAWVQSCLDAIQIHGGYGYSTEYEVERDLRDAIGGKIYSGTSEIQRNIISKNLGL
jgi:alkylation response protein AidB-like acyl-CoA dehydrogenase